MKLFIKYSSKWNFSSLLENGKSATANVKPVAISPRTGLGVLARLMGQVDKLDCLENDFPLLKKIKVGLSIMDQTKPIQDTVFLRTQHQEDGNPSGGMAGRLVDNPLFSDPEIVKSYGVLFLPLKEVIDYILTDKIDNGKLQEILPKLTPVIVWRVSEQIVELKEEISKQDIFDLDIQAEKFSEKHGLKYVPLNNKTRTAVDKARTSLLKEKDKAKKINLEKKIEKLLKRQIKEQQNPGVMKIMPSQIYNFALNKYFLEKIKSLSKFNMLDNNIPGFTHRNPLGSITPRSWMKEFVSRNKVQMGGIYKPEPREDKGFFESKSDGVLIISLDNLSDQDESEIKQSILDNGVVSFILGKKGLAYLDRIE